MLGDAYTLEYFPLFDEELAEAARYITYELRNPDAAMKLSECRLADAAKYYLKNSEKPFGRRWGYEPYKFDLELSDRLSRVYPLESLRLQYPKKRNLMAILDELV